MHDALADFIGRSLWTADGWVIDDYEEKGGMYRVGALRLVEEMDANVATALDRLVVCARIDTLHRKGVPLPTISHEVGVPMVDLIAMRSGTPATSSIR